MKHLGVCFGQEYVYDDDSGLVSTRIYSTFNSANKIYNWKKEFTKGVSLNKEIIKLALENYGMIAVFIGDEREPYLASAADWHDFSLSSKSIYRKKLSDGKEIELYVYPIEKFKRYGEDGQQVIKV